MTKRESILAQIEALWVPIRAERAEAKKHGIKHDSRNINRLLIKMEILEEELNSENDK